MASQRTRELIFADNFRGFSNTYIELSQVNFFVGENSTGKTSLMSLIALLNEFEFWLAPRFNNSRITLGTFEDIASAASRPDHFSVGVFSQTKQEPTLTGRIVRFVEQDGMPEPSAFFLVAENKFLMIWLAMGNLRYVFGNFPEGQSYNKNISKYAELSVDLYRSLLVSKENVRTIKTSRSERFPFAILPRYLASKDEELSAFEDSFDEMIAGTSFAGIAPIRARPKQIYSGVRPEPSPEGDHSPYVLKSFQKKTKQAAAFTKAIQNFGTASGLFDKITIKRLSNKATAPFELDISKSGIEFPISSVGYGVSQVLPIVVEMLARNKGTKFAIQQPEVHLHPKAQAAFGDLLYNVASMDQKSFVIETHSDFMIDRYRLALRKRAEHISTSVVFFENDGSENRTYAMPIDKDGNYPKNQPENFRDFFLNESIAMLEL